MMTAIIHSALLTEFSVTGQNELPPMVLMNKISTQTQQSTSIKMVLEDGGGTVMALEDGGGVAALRGGVGRQLKNAAVALGGGGDRRICNDGIGISVVEAKGLLLRRLCQCRQGSQERMRMM